VRKIHTAKVDIKKAVSWGRADSRISNDQPQAPAADQNVAVIVFELNYQFDKVRRRL